MERARYLIDTNSIIDYIGKKMPESGMLFLDTVIDNIPNISVITKIELLGFNASDKDEALLLSFTDDSVIFDLSDDIVNQCITLRKKHKIKLPDVIIAATALTFNLQLITRNTRDFDGIDGLTIINPWDL